MVMFLENNADIFFTKTFQQNYCLNNYKNSKLSFQLQFHYILIVAIGTFFFTNFNGFHMLPNHFYKFLKLIN